jgi:serine/threonine protein kinase
MPESPQIPGYELLDPLGGGPLTCVFSARDCAGDSACAVKMLREEWKTDATAVKLLQREARAGLSVCHPHIVRLREAHVTRPPYFLVMDLLPGESLRQRLRRENRLPVPTSLWIARQTAEALAALHRAGFRHGDVKPDNIHLIDVGNAVLIDLGFAQRPGEFSEWRRQGYVFGTVDYLAPELCSFDSDGDFATDMFSLGVTLFEMLSGRLPYPPAPMKETFRRRRSESPLDLGSITTFLSPPLLTLVERLLQRQPAFRPRPTAVVQQLIALEIATLGRRQSA